MKFNRRSFLRTSSALSLPLFLNGIPVKALANSSLLNELNPDSDRVLVLIQLNGGNDGLNTLIPLDQYDTLANLRQNIMLPESSILSLTGNTGLHPSMTGIKSLFDDGKVSLVQDVGYPDQNRSHFRSTDIWTTGSPADEFWTTGWLGKYMDTLHPTYPNNYPNGDFPDPIALTIGYLVSETCQGISSNFSLALTDPQNLSPLPEGAQGAVPSDYYGDELTFLRSTIEQTNAYTDTIQQAANSAINMVAYPNDNNLAQQLKVVAQLVAGGLQTKIYVCNIGGFDTHAEQVVLGDTLQGNHANLLGTLSSAINAFQQDLGALGISDRVMGMTFSEFGRQVRSNESWGTDHGTAAPLMLFGSCVDPGIIGNNPSISPDTNPGDGIPMQFDFRNIYGSVLMDWFDVEQSTVESILFSDFQYIPLAQSCNTTSVKDFSKFRSSIEVSNFPNPFREYTNIVFESTGEPTRISVFNALGAELFVVSNQFFDKGEHQVKIETRSLPAGNYFLRIQTDSAQVMHAMVKA